MIHRSGTYGDEQFDRWDGRQTRLITNCTAASGGRRLGSLTRVARGPAPTNLARSGHAHARRQHGRASESACVRERSPKTTKPDVDAGALPERAAKNTRACRKLKLYLRCASRNKDRASAARPAQQQRPGPGRAWVAAGTGMAGILTCSTATVCRNQTLDSTSPLPAAREVMRRRPLPVRDGERCVRTGGSQVSWYGSSMSADGHQSDQIAPVSAAGTVVLRPALSTLINHDDTTSPSALHWPYPCSS